MKFYFKLMTWMYMTAAVAAVILTVYFQVKGMRDEAIYCLICVFVCAGMLGLRNWQKKRLDRLEKDMQAKYDEQIKNKKAH